jgi:S-(hydroxymethyl)glutathione dehydrogenase / alcohol dehydrogenase
MASRTIRAAVLREPGDVRVEDVQLDPPQSGEVLVRLAAAGVCHSDLHLVDGALGDERWPMVLGHEGAGVVEQVGDGVDHVSPGDEVVLCWVPSCRSCGACRAGRPTLCTTVARRSLEGTLLDGTSRLRLPDGTPLQHGLMTACFAERAVVPGAGAIPLPGGLPLWQAALLGCAVMTGFGAVRNVARVAPGDSVVVIGLGGVGLQVLAAAKRAGAHPIVAVDRDREKLERALSRGADAAVDTAREERPVRALRTLTGGGADHAFEVVGLPETMLLAWKSLRPGATAVVIGIAPKGAELPLPALELSSDKGIRGSFYGSGDPAADLPDLARLAATGELELEGVVTRVDALDGVGDALERLRRGEGVRTVLVLDPVLADVEPARSG